MKVFKISIKFEQNERWSDRNADAEGYLIQSNGNDAEDVEGYVKVLYSTSSNPIRFIKGLYLSDNSLVFMQMSDEPSLSPICYCFPTVQEEGYWSSFGVTGFFPVIRGRACSKGHARVELLDITGGITNEELSKINQETAIIQKNSIAFSKKGLVDSRYTNWMLVPDITFLKTFLKDESIFNMKFHRGKW